MSRLPDDQHIFVKRNLDGEEIIADTSLGLYAKRLGGGSVNPVTGDFNFAVLEAYMIRGGQIAEPVRGATLIGNGAEILFKIDKIADNGSREQGMCGSKSGSIPPMWDSRQSVSVQ